MKVAPDGSPVELYALLPELGEGARVAQTVLPGSSILELGCGAGRITRQLVRLGYQVTAVDESEEMLAHVQKAETICAGIQRLDLGRRFDAVLLASNLINESAGERRAFLETCRRHANVVVVDGLTLGWRPEDGDVSSSLLLRGCGSTESRPTLFTARLSTSPEGAAGDTSSQCASSRIARNSTRLWPKPACGSSAGSTAKEVAGSSPFQDERVTIKASPWTSRTSAQGATSGSSALAGKALALNGFGLTVPAGWDSESFINASGMSVFRVGSFAFPDRSDDDVGQIARDAMGPTDVLINIIDYTAVDPRGVSAYPRVTPPLHVDGSEAIPQEGYPVPAVVRNVGIHGHKLYLSDAFGRAPPSPAQVAAANAVLRTLMAS